jgi:serine protease
MKNTTHLAKATSIAACAISMVACAWSACAAEFRTVERPIEGRYIVVLSAKTGDGGADPKGGNDPAAIAERIAREHGAELIRVYRHALRGFAVRADDKALAGLLADPRVEYVEEDGVATPHPLQNGATWGLDRSDQRHLPLSGTYLHKSAGGAGIHAYVIDSGILSYHSEFAGRMGNGFSAIIDDVGTSDCLGHGTHVAGTLAGTVWGIAKGATVHPVRVFGCSGYGTWSDVIAGVDWVTGNRILPAVANLSLGGGANTSMDAAMSGLINSGVTAVVSAGNSSLDACSASPARVPEAMTVGATAVDDMRASFSNYGPCLDLFAPGQDITSAWHTGQNAKNTISGTSMAAPHVAGAAILHLADHPGATPAQVGSAILGAATANVVADAGPGSPDRMLYIALPPVIDSLICSGSNGGSCTVSYASQTPATIAWSGGYASASASGITYTNVCGPLFGFSVQVTVRLSNSVGTSTAVASVFCRP